MIKLISFLLIIILFLSCGYAQTQLSQSEYLLTLPQGHLMQGLYAGGDLGSTGSSISVISVVNPAALSDRKGLSMGLSYEMSSDISDAWIADFGYQRNHTLYPQSFGLSYGFDDFSMGIGSSQVYNGTLDYGKFRATMRADNEQGYIDIGTVHPARKDIVIKNSVIVNYNLKELLRLTGDFYLGFAYNYNYLKSIYNIKNVNILPDIWGSVIKGWDVDILEPGFTAGIMYNFNTGNLRFLKWGLYYESQIEFDKQKTISDNTQLRFIGTIPAKIHAGIAAGFQNDFSVSSSLSWYFWERIDNSSAEDQIQVAASLSYDINNSLVPSLGVLVTDRHYDNDDDVFNINNSLFATFITAGLIYKLEHYEFDLSIADSHLLSDDWRKQTIIKIGLGYSFTSARP